MRLRFLPSLTKTWRLNPWLLTPKAPLAPLLAASPIGFQVEPLIEGIKGAAPRVLSRVEARLRPILIVSGTI